MLHRYRAFLWLTTFAVAFAATNLLFRTAWHWRLEPLPVLGIAFLTGSVFILPLKSGTIGRRQTEVIFSIRSIIYLFILVISATVFPFWLQMEGFQRTTATKGGIILSLIPVMTTVFSRLFLKRKPDLNLVVRLTLMTLGGILISWEGSLGNLNAGDWMVFTSACCYALSMVVAHRLIRAWPLELIVFLRLGLGFLLVIPIIVWRGDYVEWTDSNTILVGVLVGVLMVTFICSIYRGMELLGPEYASLFDIVAALLTGTGAYFFWEELMSPVQWIGAGMILFLSVELFMNPPELEVETDQSNPSMSEHSVDDSP